MAEDTVKVDLKHSIGLRHGPLYGPGKGVEVPRTLANALGLSTSEEGVQEDSGGFNVDKATKPELEAEAERRGITVERGDDKEGDPLVEDYRRALKE